MLIYAVKMYYSEKACGIFACFLVLPFVVLFIRNNVWVSYLFFIFLNTATFVSLLPAGIIKFFFFFQDLNHTQQNNDFFLQMTKSLRIFQMIKKRKILPSPDVCLWLPWPDEFGFSDTENELPQTQHGQRSSSLQCQLWSPHRWTADSLGVCQSHHVEYI